MKLQSFRIDMYFYVLDLIGVSVFAISGALAGMKAGLDVFGIFVIAGITAIGGGTLRDVLMNRHPLFWMRDTASLMVIAGSALLTLLCTGLIQSVRDPLLVADALGLALFAVTGAQIGEVQKLPSVVIIILGTMTGVAGGVVRDVLTSKVPLILQKDIYATAAIAGICIYLLLQRFGLGRLSASLLGIAATVALRLAAIWWGWHLPTFSVPAG